jgi:hypothetical protein
MRAPVYNSAIPDAILNTVNRALRSAFSFRVVLFFSLVLTLTAGAHATDWATPEQELARKIVAVTGPGAVALTVENRSSLSRRDSEVITNGLHASMEVVGLRFVRPEQAAATVTITLSENLQSYVWVAEIRQGGGEVAIVMTSLQRPEGVIASHDSLPLTLRKLSLFSQSDPILDVLVLEESSIPTHIAVLDRDKVALYRWQGGKWQQDQALPLTHAQPWPQDLRGRLIPARDHLFEAYLPGVACRSSSAPPITLSCQANDDPWPLTPISLSDTTTFAGPATASSMTAAIPQTRAFFAPTRNFFTGAVIPHVGQLSTVPKFYSAAPLPRDKYVLWLFAGVDGQIHLINGMSDQSAKLGWGSDIISVRTACGAGWQVLATSSGGTGADSVRTYEFPGRDPVAVSAAVDFSGEITALWTEAKGDTAIAVVHNRESGSYEAFRLALSCNQ